MKNITLRALFFLSFNAFGSNDCCNDLFVCFHESHKIINLDKNEDGTIKSTEILENECTKTRTFGGKVYSHKGELYCGEQIDMLPHEEWINIVEKKISPYKTDTMLIGKMPEEEISSKNLIYANVGKGIIKESQDDRRYLITDNVQDCTVFVAFNTNTGKSALIHFLPTKDYRAAEDIIDFLGVEGTKYCLASNYNNIQQHEIMRHLYNKFKIISSDIFITTRIWREAIFTVTNVRKILGLEWEYKFDFEKFEKLDKKYCVLYSLSHALEDNFIEKDTLLEEDLKKIIENIKEDYIKYFELFPFDESNLKFKMVWKIIPEKDSNEFFTSYSTYYQDIFNKKDMDRFDGRNEIIVYDPQEIELKEVQRKDKTEFGIVLKTDLKRIMVFEKNKSTPIPLIVILDTHTGKLSVFSHNDLQTNKVGLEKEIEISKEISNNLEKEELHKYPTNSFEDLLKHGYKPLLEIIH